MSFSFDEPFDGVLVVAQAYMHSWKLDGVEARPFVGIHCAWDVSITLRSPVAVKYWPNGLSFALVLASSGLLLAAFALTRVRRNDEALRSSSLIAS